LSFDDLLAYTVNADAGLLLYEGTLGNFFTAPGRLTEYLTCGLPVLASAYTGIENVVRGFDVGVTANAYDIDRLARGAEILEQQVRSGRFPSAEMKRRFEDHFAFDHWEPLVVSALEDCLHDRKNPDPPNKPYLPWWPGGDAWQSRSSGLV
jgi:glycosyltransferase involved in cell wall biosynthesis